MITPPNPPVTPGDEELAGALGYSVDSLGGWKKLSKDGRTHYFLNDEQLAALQAHITTKCLEAREDELQTLNLSVYLKTGDMDAAHIIERTLAVIAKRLEDRLAALRAQKEME